MSTLVETRVDAIMHAINQTIERERATSDQGCSALANALLAKLVNCRKDPRVRADVSNQMRRLAAKLLELAAAQDDTADRILSDITSATKH